MSGFNLYRPAGHGYIGTVYLPPPVCGHCKAIIDPDVPHSCPGLIEEQRQDKIREAIRTLEREGYRIVPPTF